MLILYICMLPPNHWIQRSGLSGHGAGALRIRCDLLPLYRGSHGAGTFRRTHRPFCYRTCWHINIQEQDSIAAPVGKLRRYPQTRYSPHTPVPHKSMSSKSAQNSAQRHSHNPLKHFSHPSTHHSHKRFNSCHPPRLSIDSLIRVCVLHPTVWK